MINTFDIGIFFIFKGEITCLHPRKVIDFLHVVMYPTFHRILVRAVVVF